MFHSTAPPTAYQIAKSTNAKIAKCAKTPLLRRKWLFLRVYKTSIAKSANTKAVNPKETPLTSENRREARTVACVFCADSRLGSSTATETGVGEGLGSGEGDGGGGGFC